MAQVASLLCNFEKRGDGLLVQVSILAGDFLIFEQLLVSQLPNGAKFTKQWHMVELPRAGDFFSF